ncbi:DUF397 domain-containing protein [Streptomyces sp. NPDC052236]|uniref:DUF397 domain-containing protein n=1 Tax=Streptomyces sp. NPDC052236 TaxID=3365686 RepID=UPI0037D8162A
MSTDLHWLKSSYSSNEGECVEVAASWTKSSYSGDEGECVEVAACPTTIHVRDSKNPQGPQLTVAPGAWSSFVTVVSRRSAAAS